MDVQAILKVKGKDVATIKPEATLLEAANKLVEKGIGSLVVLNSSDRIAGILTERDLLREFSRAPQAVAGKKVADAMTREVVVGSASDRIKAVQALMVERRIRHLPIVESGALVGIISIGDVVKNLLKATEDENYDLRGFLVEKNVVG